MTQNQPPTPDAVPPKATPSGDSDTPQPERLRLSKGSCLVWTERMLEALARGNEGRQWHTLIDKVFAPKTLDAALCMVTQRQGAPGMDGQTTQAVARKREAEVQLLERLLREGKYEPQPVRRVWIEKPGSVEPEWSVDRQRGTSCPAGVSAANQKRPLGIPTVRDRIDVASAPPLRGSLWLSVSLRSALSWHFERSLKRPREKSQKKLKDSLRAHTRRHNGHSLKTIITGVNRVIRGWGNYFQGGVRTTAPKLESWLRQRLRSILRNRAKRHGRGRGLDHNRYPNAYFAEQGLVSLLHVTHPQQPGTSPKRRAAR